MPRLFTYSLLLFGLMLAGGALQTIYPVITLKPLAGAEVASPLPAFSLASISDGTFQTGVDSWFSRHFGFRPALVRLDNYLTFSLFGEISASSGTPMIVGKDNYLFEQLYVDSYNRIKQRSPESIERLATAIKQLQDTLTDRGIAFQLLISPSKAEHLPDYIPRRFVLSSRNERRDDFEYFVNQLEKEKVTLLDTPHWFQKLKTNSPYPLFSPGGTHWNYYGSCLVASRLLESLSTQLKRPLRKFSCEPITTNLVPQMFDADLAKLCNLPSLQPFRTLHPYPESSDLSEGGEFRPNILFVGSSFLWTVLEKLDEFDVYAKRDFYYYFHQNASYAQSKKRRKHRSIRLTDLSKESLDWKSEVLSRDAIVLEINQAILERTGFGFVEAALKALPRTKDSTR